MVVPAAEEVPAAVVLEAVDIAEVALAVRVPVDSVVHGLWAACTWGDGISDPAITAAVDASAV